MIIDNTIPRLQEDINLTNSTKEKQPVSFIYNEMLTHDTISAVFMWLFKCSTDFETKHDESKFVVIIHPKI